MNARTRTPEELAREVLARLDPKGEMTELLDSFVPLVDTRPGRGLLRLLGAAGVNLTQTLTDASAMIADMGQAVWLFAPLGWAPLSRAPVPIYQRALGVYRRTGS